jgi:hypothetical protein
MHALVAAVLLRLTWLDALDLDAEPQPPDGEFGEVEESIWAGEGNPVVGADGIWQSAFGEQALKYGDGGFLPER